MSEYHAAVALASLDVWESTRMTFLEVAAAYREEFSRVGLGDCVITAPKIASCYAILRAADTDQAALVTLTLVTDPFGSFDRADLGSSFDFVREYKHHFVADLSHVDELPSTRNHRRNVARARASVEVEVAADPKTELGQVLPLYAAYSSTTRSDAAPAARTRLG